MYKLMGYENIFHTGRAGDGRQILMGLLCPELVAYFFSPSGTLLACETRPWGYPAPSAGANGPYNIYDEKFECRLAAQMADWQHEISFKEGLIRIEAFFDEDWHVGIKVLPSSHEDPNWDADAETLKTWRDEGVYLFYWAEEYIMSADGYVEAT